MAPPRRRAAARDDPPEHAPSQILAGRALVGGRLQPVEIAIDEDGIIQSVGRIRTGGPRRDVGDRVILPAATDVHVHLREPGGSGESIATGTIEAALGGVTLVGDMPNTTPPVTRPDRLEEKEERVTGRAAVDVLLYATPTDASSVPALAARAGALKIFVSPTTGIEEVPDRPGLASLLRAIASYDLPVSLHAEAPTCFSDEGPVRDAAGWNARRPPAAEETAIGWLSGSPGWLRLHVAHATLPSSVRALREQGWSFEATAHHLLLSDRTGQDPRFKVNPPLRSESDRSALWAAFARGEIPILASDHAPHAADRKFAEFDRAPSGMPGLETALPILLARVRAGELPLEVLTRAACDRPARWFGQPLGRIARGHRANLLIVDFRDRRAVTASELHAPCGWTAFDGWEAIWPVEHWRDGVPIVEDREYVGQPDGRVVVPEFSPAARARRTE